MRSFWLCILICFPVVCCFSKERKVSDLVLADAYVLLDQGTYYAYGTHHPEGIEVYISTDLKNWHLQPQLALHKDNTTETKKFWAPEVLKRGDLYYMFYSANEHMYVAMAESPLGPFVQASKQPFLKHGSIDCSPYIDDDGKAYLFFVYFDEGNQIYSCELSNDWLSLKQETMHKCLSVSQEWEMDSLFPKAYINEGPCINKVDGTYYLTYSANHFKSKNYGVGYATSQNINGPWIKSNRNPILQNALGRKGTGHHSIFKDKKGKLKMIYHAHYSTEKVQPRVSYFAKVYIKNGIIKVKPIN